MAASVEVQSRVSDEEQRSPVDAGTNMFSDWESDNPDLQELLQWHRMTISDEKKAGFFGRDESTQTESTEVIAIKEMNQVISKLVKELTALKRDFKLSKQSLEAQYETRLDVKSTELYNRCNEKLKQLEKLHEEKVATVRRSFKQQLADAVVQIHSSYEKHHNSEVQLKPAKSDGKMREMRDKMERMRETAHENEELIKMLKEQLTQYQEQQDDTESIASSHNAAANQELVKVLKEQISELTERVDKLNDSLDLKEETTDHLNQELSKLTDLLEKEKASKNEISKELNDLKNKMNNERASSREKMEQQKQEMEKQMRDELEKTKETMSMQASREASELQSKEAARQNQILEDKRRMEELLSKELKAREQSSNMELSQLRQSEQTLKDELQRLNKELRRVTRLWEKKFQILQNSMHAIKDEAYLRQTLKKQAVSLHHASVMYTSAAPLGVMPKYPDANTRQPVMPLPNIRHTPRQGTPGDVRSQTMSAPSGRGTEMFSTDENQIGAEYEDYEGILPINDHAVARYMQLEMSAVNTS